MTDEVQYNDFRLKTGIESVSVFKQLLRFLGKNRIGILLDKNGKQVFLFSEMDRIRASLLALQLGCDIQECSKLLSWKDFEYLTCELLSLFEYKTSVNIVLSKPRAQLDVIGIKNDFAITIDCKHWRNNNKTTLTVYAEKQIRRTMLWLQREKKITKALPMIITLNNSIFKFIKGVPVVPILTLKSFLKEFDNSDESMLLINKN
jgi:queuine/archaeosine tRNA-ribosyltransferase